MFDHEWFEEIINGYVTAIEVASTLEGEDRTDEIEQALEIATVQTAEMLLGRDLTQAELDEITSEPDRGQWGNVRRLVEYGEAMERARNARAQAVLLRGQLIDHARQTADTPAEILIVDLWKASGLV